MVVYKNKYNILYKAITLAIACLFCANSIVLANPDTLAPYVGNPRVYQEMRGMMEERLSAHQEPIDEFIKQNAGKAKNLSAVQYLEEEFMASINACGANNMLARLKTTLASTGGRMQVIFVKSEDELPVFEGQKAWGHAGTYVTVFALENEKGTKEERRKIIGRLFHEIRARSTRAKELFNEEFENKNPATPEEISAFIKSTREIFEKGNLQLQQEIGQNNRITSQPLSHEFANLTFAIHPHVMNRDYMMANGDQKLSEDMVAMSKTKEGVSNRRKRGRQLYRWRTEKDSIRAVRNAIEQYRPDIIRRYDKLEVLSPTDKEALKEDIYKIKQGHFMLWGLSNIFYEKNVPWFKGSHIDALICVFRKLELDPLGFQLKWSTPDIRIKSLQYFFWKKIPDTMSRYEKYIKLPPDRREDEKRNLSREIYKIGSFHFLTWGLTRPLNRNIAPEFNGRYEDILIAIFPELKLNRLGFELDYSTPEKAVDSVRFVLEREHPELMEQYRKFCEKSDTEITITEEEAERLQNEIYSIKVGHFQAWGLGYATLKNKVPFFGGKYSTALCQVFNNPKLAISEDGFKKYRKEHTPVKYRWKEGFNQGRQNVLDAIGYHRPDILGRYQKYCAQRLSISQEETEALKNDIYSISVGNFNIWGLSKAVRQPYFGTSHADVLIAVFPALRLEKLGFWLQLTTPEERLQSARYILRKHIPYIMEHALMADSLSRDKLVVLRRKIYDIGQGNLRIWGLSGLLNKKIAPEFNGKYPNILLAVFNNPVLKINRFGFHNDYSSHEFALNSIRAVIEKEDPELITAYEGMDNLEADSPAIESIRKKIYSITFSHFVVWGILDVLKPNKIPYFGGSYMQVLKELFNHPNLKLTTEGFLTQVIRDTRIFIEEEYPAKRPAEPLPAEKIEYQPVISNRFRAQMLRIVSSLKKVEDALEKGENATAIEQYVSTINLLDEAREAAKRDRAFIEAIEEVYEKLSSLMADAQMKRYVANIMGKKYKEILDDKNEPTTDILEAKYKSRLRSLSTETEEAAMSDVHLKPKQKPAIPASLSLSQSLQVKETAPTPMPGPPQPKDERQEAIAECVRQSGITDSIELLWYLIDKKADFALAQFFLYKITESGIVDNLPPRNQKSFEAAKLRLKNVSSSKELPDKLPSPGSIYSIFKYLCDHDVMTANNAISGEILAKSVGEEHEARQKALSFESIEDDLRGLLLHLHLIEKAPGSETGKDARYYVPESVKKKSAEILHILEQFRGKALRPKASLLDQVYEEKIKPILEVFAPSNLYYFGGRQADGKASMDEILGKKGANLAGMTLLELPVPPGFTIPNSIVQEYSKETNTLPSEAERSILTGVAKIERRTEATIGKSKKLGDAESPLFLSVRSGAAESAPGEYKTITKVGLHKTTLDAYAREIGDACQAYFDYIRFMADYAFYVMEDGSTCGALENILTKASFIKRYYKGDYNTLADVASIEELRSMGDKAETIFKQKTGREFPVPLKQLIESTRAVVKSCYRVQGAACNVQAYVFGNVNDGKSGSGVIFTRNPLNGERGIYGSFLLNTEGSNIVGSFGSGARGKIDSDWDTPKGIDVLKEKLPDAYSQLEKYARLLETHFREIQDIEFTIQNGRIFLLQTRGNEKFTTPLARVRILLDFVKEGLITEADAVKRLLGGYTEDSFGGNTEKSLSHLWWLKSYLEAPVLRSDFSKKPIANGVIILPGIISAPIYTDWNNALGSKGIVVVEQVVEYTDYRTISPHALMNRGVGAISRSGNFSDHIAVRMRGAERVIPYLTSVNLAITKSGKSVTFKDTKTRVKSGSKIILDGNNGRIYRGRLLPSDLTDSEVTKVNKGVMQRQESELMPYYETLLKWIILLEIDNIMMRDEMVEGKVVAKGVFLKEDELLDMFKGGRTLERLASNLIGNESSINEFKQRLRNVIKKIKERYQTKGDIVKNLTSELQKTLLKPEIGKSTMFTIQQPILSSFSSRSSATGAVDALNTLPQEWRENDLKIAEFTAELSQLLRIENVLGQDKSTFIFSEKVTFNNGLGVLLPKLAKSGMRVAVIATNDRQRALIDELNQGNLENERIVYADTIAEIRTKIHTARYYYFKVTGDPDTNLQGVTTFDITDIVKKIIDSLGRITWIVDQQRIELLHEAARKFAEAA